MAAVNQTQTKVRTDNPEKSNKDNVISIAQWPVDTAITNEGWLRCSKEFAESSRVASEDGIDAFVKYSGEICAITSIWTKMLFASLEETSRAFAEGKPSSVSLSDAVSEVLKVSQRLMDANVQMLERQIKIASAAGLAMSAMPSCALEPASNVAAE